MKHVVEYSAENPAYKEGRAMFKIAIAFVAVILILGFM